MEALISNTQKDVPVDLEQLKKFALSVLSSENANPDTELSIALVSKEKIRELNLTYRGIDLPTDVLSFAFSEKSHPGGIFLLGDVVIAPEVAKEQAEKFGVTFEEELILLLSHGILHLFGYDHEKPEEEKIMQEKERNLLAHFVGVEDER